MKNSTLKQQIEEIQLCIAVHIVSCVHLIGPWKGKIPPGPNKDALDILRAAVKSLQAYEKLKKKCEPGLLAKTDVRISKENARHGK